MIDFNDVLDSIEWLYLEEYDPDDVEEPTGDDVQDFLNWCRTQNIIIKHVNTSLNEVIEKEFNLFLNDMKSEEFAAGMYMNEDNYKEEYSHCNFEGFKYELYKKICGWLKENKPGEYVTLNNWCVMVMTIEKAKSGGILEETIQRSIVR